MFSKEKEINDFNSGLERSLNWHDYFTVKEMLIIKRFNTIRLTRKDWKKYFNPKELEIIRRGLRIKGKMYRDKKKRH